MSNRFSEIPPEWRTHAEITNYVETPRYRETVAYAKRLADASPLIRYESFGKSGEGRDMPLLIAAEGETFTPEAVKGREMGTSGKAERSQRKAVVLIQACIHSGEPDGKDAGLALFRDIAITKIHPDLLQRVVVLFIPIYNCDGHERVSPYNRINQKGPAEMGWRETTTNQNLNRDYMKVDTPETRAWLSLWNRWSPDLFIDCHVTDGADYGSVITYHFEHHAGIPDSVLAWEREVIQGRVGPATEAAGSVTSWYLEFIDNRDLTLGMRDFNGSPRFSTGYVPLRNRPAILIETHMLKDYGARVIGTYDFLRFALAEVNADPHKLIAAGRQADENTVKWGKDYNTSRQYPLRFELTDDVRPFHLRAVKSKVEMSEISGERWVEFGTEPIEMTVPMRDTFRVTRAVSPPLYYIVPRQWSEVIENLTHHGLELWATTEAAKLQVESYRFKNVTWANAPFEGRFLTSVEVEPIQETRTYPAGSVLVSMAQPLAKVAINLLEPEAPDSFIAWSFFSAIFEEKEYGENYILEKLAREMLAKQPDLTKEFEQRLQDASFAGDARKRLEFFYQRSPYWDPFLNVYPVGRITAPINLKSNPF